MNQTIVIADDNPNCSKNILNNLKRTYTNINIIGIATSGKETIEMVERYNPNILFLDLKMPEKNGIDVLKELESKRNITTKVIIISSEIPMINRLNLIKSKLVVNIFVKPFNWEELCLSIQDIQNKGLSNLEIIDNVMHEFSFNYSSKFYKYLTFCIDKEIEKSLSLKELYKEISRENNLNSNNLKWGIQKLINSMCRYTPQETIKKYFPYNSNPSPKIFITRIVNIVRRKIEN